MFALSSPASDQGPSQKPIYTQSVVYDPLRLPPDNVWDTTVGIADGPYDRRLSALNAHRSSRRLPRVVRKPGDGLRAAGGEHVAKRTASVIMGRRLGTPYGIGALQAVPRPVVEQNAQISFRVEDNALEAQVVSRDEQRDGFHPELTKTSVR